MFEFNLIKVKNYFLIILILISVISLYIYLNQEDDFLAFNTDNICGEYPPDFIKEDISSNPNYVFVNDPSFVSTKLWDEFGNTVFVNSFIECEHYVSGGWNFRPNGQGRVDYSSIKLPNVYKNFVYMIFISALLSVLYRAYNIRFKRNSFAFLLAIVVTYFFIYQYQETFTNSTLTVKILVTSSIFCVSQYILYRKNKITNFYKTYLALSLIIVFLFSFSENENKIFYQDSDNFGDTISLVSTYDYFFDSENLKQINNYDVEKYLYQNIYFIEVKNEYCEASFGSNYESTTNINPICLGGDYKNTPRYYSIPPLYLFVTTIFGFILFLLQDIHLVISLLTILSAFLLYSLTKKFVQEETYVHYLFQLASFPILFAIQRGNYISILNYCLIFFFAYRVLKTKNHDFLTLVSLSLAINLRPNQIVLCLLLLNCREIVTFLKSIIKTFIYSTGIFILFLRLNTIFHKEYSFESFKENFKLYGNEVLNQDLTVFGYGDGFTSSFYSFLKIFKDELSPIFYNLNLGRLDSLISVYNLNYFVLILLAIYLIFISLQFLQNEISNEMFFIKVIVASLLISPKIASYHLVLLLLPFLLLTANQILNNANILTLLMFVILPKPHSFEFPIYGISLGLLINSLLLIIVLFSKDLNSINKLGTDNFTSSRMKDK